MLPAFLCFFMASYLLPMTTQSLMGYPSCLFNEIVDLRTHDDIEKVLKMKPSDVIRQQLSESLLHGDDQNTSIGSLTRQHSESMSTTTNSSRYHSRANSSVWNSLRQE